MNLFDRLFHRPQEPDDEPVLHELHDLENGHGPALRRAQRAIRSVDKILDDYAIAEEARKR